MRFLTNVDISNFYSNFLNLDKQDFDNIIEKFQENEKLVEMLPVTQKIDIKILYLNALYQMGRYGVFLRNVDETIEDVFRYNYEDKGDNKIFLALLLKKATALFHQENLGNAEHVATELVKIDPEEPLYMALLTRIYYKKHQERFQFLKFTSLVLVLIASVSFGSNLLVVYPIRGAYLSWLFDIGFFSLNSAILIYVIAEISMFGHAVLKSKRRIHHFRKSNSTEDQN